MAWASVDPGLDGTGWAVWSKDNELIDYGVIKLSKQANTFTDRKRLLTNGLYIQLAPYNIRTVYIEYPKKFNSLKGDMVADKGDLVKLAELVGYFTAYFNVLEISVIDIDINKWKGQMSKEAVINRISRLLPGINPHSHDWDAIGIGLYVKGDF